MAIVRIIQKPEIFKYEGVEVGLRKPTTREMEEIVKKRSAYLKTVVADLVEQKANETESFLPAEGDGGLLIDLQQYISGLLCCDPNDATNPWFAKDTDEQAQLAKSGVEKDTVADVPADFHATAFAKFSGVYQEPAAEGAGDPDKGPLSAEASVAQTTTSTSDVSSSESPSDSTSTPSPSEIGGTTTSETA